MLPSSKEEGKKCENQSCDTQVTEVQEVPQAPGRDTTVQQVWPQQPTETTLEHVVFAEGLQSLGKTQAWTREKCEEERAAGKSCPLLSTAPPVPVRVRGKR